MRPPHREPSPEFSALRGESKVSLATDYSILLRSPQRLGDPLPAAPGAALGTTRKRFADDDLPQVIDFIDRHEITHWLIIGGNDSASTALTVGAAAKDAGLGLTVLLVPKTVDNDLVGTDHSPGYGSAARFVASATQGAGRDAEAMGPAAPITVIEVAGRDSGWLAAASVLGKREPRDAPHVVVTPEVAFRPVTSLVRDRECVPSIRVRRRGHPRKRPRQT